MKPLHLFGLILLWSINECTGQGIVNNCTCKTFDGGIYGLMAIRKTDGKQLRFLINGSKYPGWWYTYNPCAREHHPEADRNKICRDVAIFRFTHLCSCGRNDQPVYLAEKPLTVLVVPQNVGISVAAAAGTTVFLLVPLLLWRTVKHGRNRNNDVGEYQNLPGEQYVNEYGPRQIQESSAGMFESLPRSSSNSKPDVNIVRSSRTMLK